MPNQALQLFTRTPASPQNKIQGTNNTPEPLGLTRDKTSTFERDSKITTAAVQLDIVHLKPDFAKRHTALSKIPFDNVPVQTEMSKIVNVHDEVAIVMIQSGRAMPSKNLPIWITTSPRHQAVFQEPLTGKGGSRPAHWQNTHLRIYKGFIP